MTEEEARWLLRTVEEFLLKPRRGKRDKRTAPRTRYEPHSSRHAFDERNLATVPPGHNGESAEEMRRWRAALKGPRT